MKDSKNQIIRSMKSYDEGGSTDESCGPGDGGRGRSRGKGCHKVTKFGRRGIPEPVKKVAKAAAVIGGGAIAYAKNAFGVKDKVKELMGQKTGGSVKMQRGGAARDEKRRLKKSLAGVKKGYKPISGPSFKTGGTTRKYQNGGTANSMPADAAKRIASSARSGVDNMNTNTTQGQKLNMARPTASGVDNMTTNTTAGQKLNYKSGGTTKRKMQVGGMAKRPTLSARVKPVVKAVKTVKATIKRRG
jgi:hypothetical protein